MPKAYAEENLVAKRDPRRLSRSLGVAYGSESFRFFLAQKIDHWKNQSANILTTENYSKKKLVTRDSLVAAFIDGESEDPVEKLSPEDKVGFPVPETRIVTIENAIQTFQNNVDRLNGVIGDYAQDRNDYIELLNEMRDRFNISDDGLSDNSTLSAERSQLSSQGFCLNSSRELDIKCSCNNSNSCQNFKIGKLTDYNLSGIKTDSKNAEKYVKSVLSGDLSGANISAGSLRKKAGLNSRNLANESNRSLEKTQQRSLSTLSQKLKSSDGDGKFLRLANRLSGLENRENNSSTDGKEKQRNSQRKSLSRSQRWGSMIKNSSQSGAHNNSHGDSDTFSFDTSEESSSKAGEKSQYMDEDRYKHKRRLGKKKKGNGIEMDRDKTIFSVISKRYEKTAFPVFLLP